MVDNLRFKAGDIVTGANTTRNRGSITIGRTFKVLGYRSYSIQRKKLRGTYMLHVVDIDTGRKSSLFEYRFELQGGPW